MVSDYQKTGKMRLSMRALTPKPEGYVEPERRPRGDRNDRRGGRDDRRGGHDDRRSFSRRDDRDDRRPGRDDRRGDRDSRDSRDDRRNMRRNFTRRPEDSENSEMNESYSGPSYDDNSSDELF